MISEKDAEGMVIKLELCVDLSRKLLSAMSDIDEDYSDLRRYLNAFSTMCYDKERGIKYVLG